MERTLFFDTLSNTHSEEIGISVIAPFEEVPAETKLCVFANNRQYVPYYDSQKMLAQASKFAKDNKMWLIPERFAVNDYLCLCIINADGVPVGLQRSCHLSLSDRGSFMRDNKIDIISTPLGKIALLPSVDMNIPYVLTEAVLQGAELFVASLYIAPYDFSPERANLYALNVAQSTSVPVAAAVASGGVIVNGDWTMVSPFSSQTPVFGKVIPSQWRVDKVSLEEGVRLLKEHRELFIVDDKEAF